MKKKLLITAAAALFAGAIAAGSASAYTSGGATVTADLLNLRTEPSVSSASLGLVSEGDFLLVEEQSGDWYKVCADGVEAYVSAQYISVSETLDGSYGHKAEVTGDYVRMRAGASTSDAVLGSFDSGAEFDVVGVSGQWLKVSGSGLTGYIRSDYLSYGGASAGANTGTAYSQGTTGQQIVETAKKYLGTPYVWAGMSENGFDCSGFVNYVYKLHGYSMNRVAQDIYSNDGTAVNKENLAPGDLVFFGYGASGVTHVGMYIGNGQFIHASSSQRQVVITNLSDGYYTRMWVGAKRIA